jgi:AT-rich interactive domain-containing protein 2
LDGILPKDPSFVSGKVEDNLSDLLHKSKPVQLANGVKENNLDYSKLNGDSMTLGKRGPQDIDGGILPAAKKPAVDNNGSASPMTNGLPNGGVLNGNSNGQSTGPMVKLVAGGQVVVQNSLTQHQQQQQAPQIIQTSSGQFYLKASSANGGSTMVPGQQVINQQGKAVLVFNQDPKSQQQHYQPQQQQIVKQVINTPSGQQIVRQVVVPSGTAMVPQLQSSGDGFTSHHNSVVTTNGMTDLTTNARQTPPLTNGDSTLSPSMRPAPQPPSASSSPPPAQPPVKIDPGRPFLCEWAGCMKPFKTPKEVEKHAIAEHCPLRLEGEDIPCLWARCDGMKRKRFSLMTHFQDRHCHPQLMKLMAVRRVQIAHNGKSDVPLPPAQPPHPGYAPNAALHAIKRHAQEFATPKEQEMKDEKEGPVTKSIRLTASLILRNLVIYSPSGRLRIRAYESHLSTVALSNVESSRTVAQILYEMDNAKEFT